MADWNITQLEKMSPEEERQFWRRFEDRLRRDDGKVAREHLRAGNPIYYSDEEFPGYVVREWPDGRRELVTVSVAEGMKVARQL
nr:hypothetical protein [uncultured Cupriavidus sp.]